MLAAVLAFLIQNQFSFGVVAITSLFWVIWGMVMVVGEGQEVPVEKEISWLEIPWLPVTGVVLFVILLIYISFFSFRGDIWFKSGKTNMQMRRFAPAARNLETSLRVFPFEGGTVSHLGIVYLNLFYTSPEKERHLYLDKAISTLKYGTRVDPYNADNFYLLSKIYFGMLGPEALETAREYAEAALKIDPYYAEVYHVLGLINERQGRLRDAAEMYEKAFFINPNLSEPMQSLENLFRKTGKPFETLKVFERALNRYGDNLIILERMSRLYLERGQIDKTLSIAEKMIVLDPALTAGYILRAEAYLRKANVDQAFSDLQQVIHLDPKNISAHLSLGRIYLIKKDPTRAREEFEQVLLLDPNNAVAKKMLEKL